MRKECSYFLNVFNDHYLRMLGAWSALALFIAVYPANIYMAIDYSDRELPEQLFAYARLPLQFGLFYWAWAIAIDINKNLQTQPA